MRGELFTVEFDGGELAAFVMVEGEAVVIRQAQVFQLAAGVVAVAQGAPALVFGDEAVLAVVGIVDNAVIGQGFSYEASGVVSLVAGE